MPSHCIPLPYFRPFALSPFPPNLPYNPLFSSPSPILPITLCPEACCYNPYFLYYQSVPRTLLLLSPGYHFTPSEPQPFSYPHLLTHPSPLLPQLCLPDLLQPPCNPVPSLLEFPALQHIVCQVLVSIPTSPTPMHTPHHSPLIQITSPSPISSPSPIISRPLLSSQHLLPAPNPEVSITSWLPYTLLSLLIPFTSIVLITLATHPTPCLLSNIVLEHLWPSILSTASKTQNIVGNHPKSPHSPPTLLLIPKVTLPNLTWIASNCSITLPSTAATSIPSRIPGKFFLSQMISIPTPHPPTPHPPRCPPLETPYTFPNWFLTLTYLIPAKWSLTTVTTQCPTSHIARYHPQRLASELSLLSLYPSTPFTILSSAFLI